MHHVLLEGRCKQQSVAVLHIHVYHYLRCALTNTAVVTAELEHNVGPSSELAHFKRSDPLPPPPHTHTHMQAKRTLPVLVMNDCCSSVLLGLISLCTLLHTVSP
jgi:hypothetical protein